MENSFFDVTNRLYIWYLLWLHKYVIYQTQILILKWPTAWTKIHSSFSFFQTRFFAQTWGLKYKIIVFFYKVNFSIYVHWCFTKMNARYSLIIPAWYINKFTIINFTIYTRLFLVKLKRVVEGPILNSKSVVDGPILHSKSVVDGSILHCKAKVCVFSKIWW